MGQKTCDHTSVGMIVRRAEGLLLIERRRLPFGFAPPAGHVDDDPSYEVAAERELSEEVGLKTVATKLVLDQDVNNPCRRLDGTWHHWKVYEVEASGTPKRSLDETKQLRWVDDEELGVLAARTRQYMDGKISEEAWQQNPGLEVVWYEHFVQLNVIQH